MSGYVFVPVQGVDELLQCFKKRNFDEDIPPKSYIEGRQPAEKFKKQFGGFYRDSWFLSEDYKGPFGSLVDLYLAMIQPIIEQFFKDRPELAKAYPLGEVRKSMGVHRYIPEMAGENDVGLPDHMDVDLLTILVSDGPLQGVVDDERVDIHIPKGHVMVFTDLTTCAVTGERPLLHCVPKMDTPKFSIGAFIGAPGNSPFVITEKAPKEFEKFRGKTVDDFQRSYFSEGFTI